MRISDWSSDVCSSDLGQLRGGREAAPARSPTRQPNASILWAAGWGSGPVSPRKSLFRDFPNERPTRHHARESRGFCCPAPLAAAGIRFCRSEERRVGKECGVDLGGRRIIKKKKNSH